jgi:sugar lactone lactonase YvrE
MLRFPTPLAPQLRCAALAVTALALTAAALAQTARFVGFQTTLPYTTPKMAYPRGVAVDSQGNVYISDSFNDQVLKLTYSDGGYTQSVIADKDSGLTSPESIAVDAKGNLYVVVPNTIYKLTPAGGGKYTRSEVVSGFSYTSSCVAIDAKGNVYTCGAKDIYKYTLGDGGKYTQSNIGTYPFPTALAVDSKGNVYVTANDSLNLGDDKGTLYKLTLSEGKYTGKSLNTFSTADGVAVDATGNLYVADGSSNSAYMASVSSDGKYSWSTIAFVGLKTPTAIAADSNGNVYLADQGNGRVLKQSQTAYFPPTLVKATSPLKTSAIFLLGTPGTDTTITGIKLTVEGSKAMDFNNVHTGSCKTSKPTPFGYCTVDIAFTPTEPGKRRGAVQLLDKVGKPFATGNLVGIGKAPEVEMPPGKQEGPLGAPPKNVTNPALLQSFHLLASQPHQGGSITSPNAVALDGDDNLFVADSSSMEIFELTPQDNYSSATALAGGASVGNGFTVAIDGAGDVIALDSTTLYILSPTDNYASATTLPLPGGFFSQPNGIAFDGSGNIYVADLARASIIELFASTGYTTATDIAGGFGDPSGIAIDSSGDLFVSDSSGSVYELTPSSGFAKASIGSGFSCPNGIAVDPAGNVYVSDECLAGVSVLLAPKYTAPIPLAGSWSGPGAIDIDSKGNLFVGDKPSGVFEIDLADPPTLTFQSPGPGIASPPQSVQLLNTGNLDLDWYAPGVAFTPLFSYIAGSTPPSDCTGNGTLAPGAECFLNIVFTPTPGQSAFTGAATLDDDSLNAPASGPAVQTIPLAGASLSPGSIGLDVSPSTGYGTVQQFTFTATATSPATVAGIYMLLDASLDSAGSCYFKYITADNLLYLRSDDGSSWSASGQPGSASGQPGSAGIISNSQCSINLAQTPVTPSGGGLTIAPTVTFLPPFYGGKRIFMDALDSSNSTSGWAELGTWMADSIPEAAPSAVSVTPASGLGASGLFSFAASSPNTAGNLQALWILIRNTFGAQNACYLKYIAVTQTLYLQSDNGLDWSLGDQLGQTGQLSNSQCSITVSGATATPSGNTLTLTLPISFTDSFSGPQTIWLDAVDDLGESSLWTQLGAWTVTPASPDSSNP